MITTHVSPAEYYTATRLDTRILDMIRLNIAKSCVDIEFSSADELVRFRKIYETILREAGRLDLLDQKESPTEPSALRRKTTPNPQELGSESIQKEQKELLIILRDYKDKLDQLEAKHNVKIVVTSNKFKIFAREKGIGSDVEACREELEELCNKLSIHLLDKNGMQIYESTYYANKHFAPHIKLIEIKRKYYFYYNRREISTNEVKEKINSIKVYEHKLVPINPVRSNFGSNTKRLITSLYEKYLTQKLIKDSDAENECSRTEISRSGRYFILKSKNLQINIERKEKLEEQLHENTLLFFFELSPNADLQGAKFNSRVSRFASSLFTVVQDYEERHEGQVHRAKLVGFIISKKHLKKILAENQVALKQMLRILDSLFEANKQESFTIGLFFRRSPDQELAKFLATRLEDSFQRTKIGRYSQTNHLWIYEPKISGSANFIKVLEVFLRADTQSDKKNHPSKIMNDLSVLSVGDISSIVDKSNSSMMFNALNQNTQNLSKTEMTRIFKKSEYDVCLRTTPLFSEIEQTIYHLHERDRDMERKLNEATGGRYKAYKLIIHIKLHPAQQLRENYERAPENFRTYLTNDQGAGKISNGENVKLFKLSLGRKMNGLLVHVDIDEVSEDKEGLWCKEAGFGKVFLTHKVQYLQ